MKTQLDALVEFLSGREGEETGRLRLELADPESDAARFLGEARRLSGDMFTPHFFKTLGLPPSAPDHVPDVPRPPSPPPPGRRLLRILPWLTTALASGAVLWLVLTCPCHHPKAHGPHQFAVGPPATVVRPEDPVAGSTPPRSTDKHGHDGGAGVGGVSNPPHGTEPTRPRLDGFKRSEKEALQQQVSTLKSLLETEQAEAKNLREQLEKLQRALESANVKNDSLRQQAARQQRDLEEEKTQNGKLREEAVGLRAQNEQIGRGRDEARKKLQALREEVQKRSQEITDLLNKLQEQQRVNEGLRKDLSAEGARATKMTAERDRLNQELLKARMDLATLRRGPSRPEGIRRAPATTSPRPR
jgi:hypothetical protein